MSASHVHRRNNAPKWSSTFPMQATAPDTNPFRKLPIWVRLIILVTVLSTGTAVLSRLLTWTPKAITRAPIKVDSGSSGILLVETPPPTTTKPKVLVDGTVGIKVLNDHLEAAKVAAEAAAKVPSVTSEVWKRVAPIDKPEDKVDAFAAAHRAANSSIDAESSSLRKKQQKANNINNNSVPGSLPSNSEEFWLSYPHDDTLSKCGTFSPKRHLVRVCSEEEMLDFRFFRLQSVATGRWMGRSVSWEATNLTRAQRTMQFLYHPIHYKAWSIQAQTRLHLTCGSSNRLSFGSLAITGHEMWMPVFGNASGPTRTISTAAPTSTSELPMSPSTRPSRKSKQLRKRPQLLQQQVEVMSFDHKYSSEDATSGPYMYLQSMRSNRFVASKDATMWASGNNRTDTDYIVQFIIYADVRRRCQPLEDVAHQSVSASADIDGDSTQPEKLSRRQKAIIEGNTCFGKRYTPKGPFLHPPNDDNTLLPLVSTYQLPNESYVANLSNPIDPTVIVRRTLANWALLGGVQPLLLVDTNHSRGVVNEVLGRVDRLIQLGELEDPRLGARELLWAYLNSTSTAPATTTEPPTSATTVVTADITLESVETTVDPPILRSTRKGDKSNSTTTRPSNNKKKVTGGIIPTTSTPPVAAVIAPALDMKGDGFEMDTEFKKPTYRGLFHAAFQRYPYTPYVMYSNIDVLYTSSLIVSLRAVEKYVANQIRTRAEAGVTTVIRGWMVVGLRHGREMPAGWSPLSKSATSWEGDVMGYTKSYSSPDEPSPDTLDRDAIDYIIVSRGLFDWMNSIPTFVVGGIKFKKWIVNKANKLAQSGEALVFDGSATITAVHQKPHIGGVGDGQHYVEGDLPSHVYNSRLATENGGWSMGSVGDVSLALEFDNGPNITVYDKHRLLFG